jgi:hypothetical protein
VSIKTFTVTFPTEAGFIGRECNSSGCGRYFKVHEDSLRDHMYCPYCAEKFEKDQLYTKDQLEHAENQAADGRGVHVWRDRQDVRQFCEP